MVYAEATTVLPLIASYLYHSRSWEKRNPREWSKLFPKKEVIGVVGC
jgi:deoxyhypusine synthase